MSVVQAMYSTLISYIPRFCFSITTQKTRFGQTQMKEKFNPSNSKKLLGRSRKTRPRKIVSKIRRNACCGENKVVDSLAIRGNPSLRCSLPTHHLLKPFVFSYTKGLECLRRRLRKCTPLTRNFKMSVDSIKIKNVTNQMKGNKQTYLM